MKDFFAETCSKCANKADARRHHIFRDEFVNEGGCKLSGIEAPRQDQCPILIETVANGNGSDCAFCACAEIDKHLCTSDWPCDSPRKQCLSCGKMKVDAAMKKDLIFYCDEKVCIFDIIAQNELLAKAAKIKE